MKRKSLLRTLVFFAAWIISITGPVRAQNAFTYAAALDSIRQTGFYKIILLPEITAECKQDLADLRISDPGGQFVPYVLRSDFSARAGEGFDEFPILPVRQGVDSPNDVVIANWSSSPVHSLLLYIRNISSRRSCTLSGSDDKQKWFVIREHVVLEPEEDNNTVYYIQRINFPASNYRYFKIIQEEKNVLPVNIIRAGIATQHITGGSFRSIPAPRIKQKDSSNHHSYIKLSWAEAYLIDRLELDIKGPSLYKRRLRIAMIDSPYSELSREIDTGHHSIELPSFKTKELLIDINNEDNAPLIINKARTSQLERYLLAYLESGSGYRLLVGNKRATVPEYDLKYFVDSVRMTPEEILPDGLKPTAVGSYLPVVKPNDNKSVYLWVTIVAVLTMLIWLCLNMLTSIRKSKQNEDTK